MEANRHSQNYRQGTAVSDHSPRGRVLTAEHIRVPGFDGGGVMGERHLLEGIGTGCVPELYDYVLDRGAFYLVQHEKCVGFQEEQATAVGKAGIAALGG